MSAQDIRTLQFPKVDGETSLRFFERVTLDLDELVDSVELNFHDDFPGTKISRLKFVKSSEVKASSKAVVEKLSTDNWIQQVWLNLGRCYTYSIPENLKKLNVNIIFDIFCHNFVIFKTLFSLIGEICDIHSQFQFVGLHSSSWSILLGGYSFQITSPHK